MTKTITVIKKRNNIFLLAVFFLVIIIFSYVVGVGYEKNLRNLSNFDNNFFVTVILFMILLLGLFIIYVIPVEESYEEELEIKRGLE